MDTPSHRWTETACVSASLNDSVLATVFVLLADFGRKLDASAAGIDYIHYHHHRRDRELAVQPMAEWIQRGRQVPAVEATDFFKQGARWWWRWTGDWATV